MIVASDSTSRMHSGSASMMACVSDATATRLVIAQQGPDRRGRKAGHKGRSSLSPPARVDILAPRRCPGFSRGFQVDDDPAFQRAVGDRLAQLDLAVSEIIGRDM